MTFRVPCGVLWDTPVCPALPLTSLPGLLMAVLMGTQAQSPLRLHEGTLGKGQCFLHLFDALKSHCFLRLGVGMESPLEPSPRKGSAVLTNEGRCGKLSPSETVHSVRSRLLGPEIRF